mmetsp:Transcript_42811/g.50194  ORF Transcript_42811/g.50194 Transcript_42811/m.50194 type:complete len:143 (-) Transcript_42811:340-768(-)
MYALLVFFGVVLIIGLLCVLIFYLRMLDIREVYMQAFKAKAKIVVALPQTTSCNLKTSLENQRTRKKLKSNQIVDVGSQVTETSRENVGVTFLYRHSIISKFYIRIEHPWQFGDESIHKKDISSKMNEAKETIDIDLERENR